MLTECETIRYVPECRECFTIVIEYGHDDGASADLRTIEEADAVCHALVEFENAGYDFKALPQDTRDILKGAFYSIDKVSRIWSWRVFKRLGNCDIVKYKYTP